MILRNALAQFGIFRWWIQNANADGIWVNSAAVKVDKPVCAHMALMRAKRSIVFLCINMETLMLKLLPSFSLYLLI